MYNFNCYAIVSASLIYTPPHHHTKTIQFKSQTNVTKLISSWWRSCKMSNYVKAYNKKNRKIIKIMFKNIMGHILQ